AKNFGRPINTKTNRKSHNFSPLTVSFKKNNPSLATKKPKNPRFGLKVKAKTPVKAKKPKDPLALPKPINVSPAALKFISKIGFPEEKPFVPDPFQLKAVELVKTMDVIVSAPTGSGKTWIAERALAFELERGGQAWYASPLKALSNSKYYEFRRIFGEDKVGLLTGDLKINAGAPIVVGTTEILRNQLYDALAMDRDGLVDRDLVVLDEAHYLGDPQRGVVWEETLIYLPTRVRLLLLSATIDNADELAAWLSQNRGQPTQVVLGGERPVPLEPLSFTPMSFATLNEAVKNLSQRRRGGYYKGPTFRAGESLRALDRLELTPAIFFLTSRKQCDEAIVAAGQPVAETETRRQKRLSVIQKYETDFPILSQKPQIQILKRKAVASHHAGHLPVFKTLVEDLMSQGLLSAIFATSTVSAGVNFPARTVVIPQSDRYNGLSFDPITATELAQMTGRAGRRGKDNIGFAVIIPGPHTDLKYLAHLFKQPPEPILSQLVVNFPMVLNLLKAMELGEAHRLLTQSLAAWQLSKLKTPGQLKKATKIIWRDFMNHVKFLKLKGLVDQNDRLTAWGELTAKIRLEHPLIMFEAIKNDSLPTQDPALLAGVVASFLNEKRSLFTRKIPDDLTVALATVFGSIADMSRDLIKHDFEVPTRDPEAALAVYRWANESPFEEVARLYGLGEGDVARLILRAAEHLNQLRDLPGQEELAQTATVARQKLLREPVL
ncbi:MAG: DEAD/DEAH box helicase, partial [Deltaproteobacteria bacterium]|nr:DEAD/DEAH box helicase [Deltaproteobacteria bacterium]